MPNLFHIAQILQQAEFLSLTNAATGEAKGYNVFDCNVIFSQEGRIKKIQLGIYVPKPGGKLRSDQKEEVFTIDGETLLLNNDEFKGTYCISNMSS
ncbi:MAG: hypothetical protein ACTSUE_08060 [Promethearchaeota archaeon]